MVRTDYFRSLSEEEKAKYEFEFCQICPFYKCELVNEYAHFREAHRKIHKSQVQKVKAVGGPFKVEVKEVRGPMEADNEERVQVVQSEIWVEQADESKDSSSEEDAISYNPNELENRCFMSCRYVYQIECGRKRVTEGIGEHFKIELDYKGKIKNGIKDRWEPLQPVFISAQTGQGKNYFIEHTLIPYVRELNYQVKMEI